MLRVVATIVLSVALLAVAGVFGVAGLRDWRLWTAMRRLRPTTPEQLVERARTRRLARELVAVVGFAHPGEGGPLFSPVNAAPCVWHRHTVHHRPMRSTADGRSRPALRRRRVADVSSREPLILTGATARVEVHPQGMLVDRPARAATKILPGVVSRDLPDDLHLLGRDLYAHREWIIQSGTALYVLAEATATRTGVVARRPARGPQIISSRSIAGLRRHLLATAVVGFAIAVTGLGLAVATLFVL